MKNEFSFLKEEKYNFLHENELLRDNIFILTLSGSRAYGLALEDSDIDLRGSVLMQKKHLLGFQKFEVYDDEKTDTKIYGINKYFRMLLKADPIILETLFAEKENTIICSKIGQKIRDNKELFLSKKYLIALKDIQGKCIVKLRKIMKIV